MHNGTIFYKKYIYHQNIGKIILMIMEVEFSPNNRLESGTIQNINLLIQIDII